MNAQKIMETVIHKSSLEGTNEPNLKREHHRESSEMCSAMTNTNVFKTFSSQHENNGFASSNAKENENPLHRTTHQPETLSTVQTTPHLIQKSLNIHTGTKTYTHPPIKIQKHFHQLPTTQLQSPTNTPMNSLCIERSSTYQCCPHNILWRSTPRKVPQ